jgi:hypothetical protein
MYSLKMTGFEAYKMYMALKKHFSTKSYDYFKYNGIINIDYNSFEKRNDKIFFTKLSKKKNVMGFLISLFVYGKKDTWIGDVIRNEEADELFSKWQRVKESITYVFSNDLDKLDDNFVNNIKIEYDQHPYLLKLLLGDHIHVETFIILNDIIKFVPSWNKSLGSDFVWLETRMKCKKYQPFLEYDKEKCVKILVDKFGLDGKINTSSS